MPSTTPTEEPTPPPREASLRQVVAVVLSSFLGIRKGTAMRKDAVTIRPHQVVIVAVVLAAVFVLILLLVVRLVIRFAAA